LDKEKLQGSQNWIDRLFNEIRESGEAMQGSYIPLVKPGAIGLEAIYGSNWELLQKLKSKLDPRGVFNNTVPRL
jgi:FAD/FMN-containing dehydrogenase